MKIVPVTLDYANDFVSRLHRHHKPVPGCKFCIGVEVADELVGVAIVGRPVSRNVDQRFVAEVIRNCTDGTFNACSKLYGAASRVAKEMGFNSIQTYTLPEEGGASLRASGWEFVRETGGGLWDRPGRARSDEGPTGRKWLWRKTLK